MSCNTPKSIWCNFRKYRVRAEGGCGTHWIVSTLMHRSNVSWEPDEGAVESGWGTKGYIKGTFEQLICKKLSWNLTCIWHLNILYHLINLSLIICFFNIFCSLLHWTELEARPNAKANQWNNFRWKVKVIQHILLFMTSQFLPAHLISPHDWYRTCHAVFID